MKNQLFIQQLTNEHNQTPILPNKDEVNEFMERLLALLFPAYHHAGLLSPEQIHSEWHGLQSMLTKMLAKVREQSVAKENADSFFEALPDIADMLKRDAKAIEQGDPAACGLEEVMRCYPGFYAIAVYRLAHHLHQLQTPIIPRMLTELAHSKTGIDIHPGAQIGSDFFIDHGTGVVIGETAILGKGVKLYQGVTLGALSVKKELSLIKRHPTIEDDVVIYAGATILGGETVIGAHSTIGGNVWLTESVEPNSLVYHKAEVIIKKRDHE
ncbi:MAG TPA: serine O-acetyltransferase EpsC [Luteibaculaceae bacterium]|nr:serine O-acetyltransferase EpsC [Luteibaculaceae bacterium]